MRAVSQEYCYCSRNIIISGLKCLAKPICIEYGEVTIIGETPERSPKGIHFAAKSMVLERKAISPHSLLYATSEGILRPEAVSVGGVERKPTSRSTKT
jgi:hypothetical protein